MTCKTCTPVLTLTPQLPHHGKETCSVCHRFIRWVPKPETQARQNRNAAAIVLLRNEKRLSDWERKFIETLDGQGPKISPKQQEILSRLIERFLQ